jgi:DNA-binding response OmpR family regulator
MVAIVDDDPQISRALGAWLDLHTLRASHHISGESLLQAIRTQDGNVAIQIGVSNPVSFALVGAVLDLNLPGINGIELARTLHRMAPALPLVIVTALGHEDRSPYGQLPPGVCCLKKPFELDELEQALFPQLQ